MFQSKLVLKALGTEGSVTIRTLPTSAPCVSSLTGLALTAGSVARGPGTAICGATALQPCRGRCYRNFSVHSFLKRRKEFSQEMWVVQAKVYLAKQVLLRETEVCRPNAGSSQVVSVLWILKTFMNSGEMCSITVD